MKNRIGKIGMLCLSGVAFAMVLATLPSLVYAGVVQNSNGVPTCSPSSTAKFGGSNDAQLVGSYLFPGGVVTGPNGRVWIKGNLTLNLTRGPLYSKDSSAKGYNLTPQSSGCLQGKPCVLHCGYGYSRTAVGDSNTTPHNLIAWQESYPFTMPLK